MQHSVHRSTYLRRNMPLERTSSYGFRIALTRAIVQVQAMLRNAAPSHLHKLLICRPAGGDHIGLEVHFGDLDGEVAHAARPSLDQHARTRLGSTPRLQCLSKMGVFRVQTVVAGCSCLCNGAQVSDVACAGGRMTAASAQKMWLWPWISKCTPGLGAAPDSSACGAARTMLA